jgi:hypothetical protein
MGVDVRFHLDPMGQDMAVEHVQDCTPILEWNRQARCEEQPSDWGRHVARIPNVVLVKWLDEEFARGRNLRLFSAEFNELVERKLKDPEWAYLRVDRPSTFLGWDGVPI